MAALHSLACVAGTLSGNGGAGGDKYKFRTKSIVAVSYRLAVAGMSRQ